MMPDGMLRFDCDDVSHPVSTCFLILNPLNGPHEVRSAVIDRDTTFRALRKQLAPHTDTMGSLHVLTVRDNGRLQTMIVDAAAQGDPKIYNADATRLYGTGFKIYGRAILLPYRVTVNGTVMSLPQDGMRKD